jgi:lipopolysaccharide/colanic/teichoic acid biosynthesis glycosyltransferase
MILPPPSKLPTSTPHETSVRDRGEQSGDEHAPEGSEAVTTGLSTIPAPGPGGLPSGGGRRLRRTLLHLRLFAADIGPLGRRAVDVAVAGAALVTLSPVFIATAVAIRATSPGPVFYRQERFGRHAETFSMLKFRTMFVDADERKAELEKQLGEQAVSGGVRFKMKSDPRITPVGGVLRRFSIDELPQLWNVVRGDMTLVGPRPPVRREVENYTPLHLRRLEVTQGLTCLWQVGGRSDLSFDEQVELDLEYIDRTRVKDELKIVAKTIPAVVSGKGAY